MANKQTIQQVDARLDPLYKWLTKELTSQQWKALSDQAYREHNHITALWLAEKWKEAKDREEEKS